MKNLSLLVGMLALGTGSLQASGQASQQGSGQNQQGQPSTHPTHQNEGTKHMGSFDPEEIQTGIGVDYLGGFFGPTDMTNAQDGVHTTAATTNVDGRFANGDLSWSNGFMLHLWHATGSGQNIGVDFIFLQNDTSNKGGLTKDPASTTLQSTHTLNPTNTTQTSTLSKVKSNYKLNSHIVGKGSTSMPIAQQANTSFYLVSSVEGGQLKHGAHTEATLQADQSVQKIDEKETSDHVGIHAEVIASKKLYKDCYLTSSAKVGSHGMKTQRSVVSNNWTTTTDNGKNVNTNGTYYRMVPMYDATIGLVWSYEMESGGKFIAHADWRGGTMQNATMMYSNFSGVGAQQSQNINTGLLEVGIAFFY